MKKTLSLLLALIVIICGTVLADENPETKTTDLSYAVASKYTVTIPQTVTITSGSGTGSFGVNAGSLIEPNKNLTFTITDSTYYGGEPAGFRLVNAADDTKFLNYTITDDESPAKTVVKGTAFLTATAAECNAGKSVSLTYTTDTATAAGTYTDTLTIGIALASKTTTP